MWLERSVRMRCCAGLNWSSGVRVCVCVCLMWLYVCVVYVVYVCGGGFCCFAALDARVLQHAIAFAQRTFKESAKRAKLSLRAFASQLVASQKQQSLSQLQALLEQAFEV